tara:strand:+ start:431 stop:817 length:387 start_codon:yes stop_codon:yes gene_type:complete
MKEILPKNLVENTYYYIYCRWIDNCKYIKSKSLYNRKLIGKISTIKEYMVGSTKKYRVIFKDVYIMPKREKTYDRYLYLDGETSINNSEIIYKCIVNPIVAEKTLYSYALNKYLRDITGDKYFYTEIL